MGKPIVQRSKEEYNQFFRSNDDSSSYVCNGCESVYQSITGIRSHLNTTYCGFGDRFRSSPKTCYSGLYNKIKELFICLGCNRPYNSNAGVLSHLKATKCGFGDRIGSAPKTSYSDLYKKCEDKFICAGCDRSYTTNTGIISHLKVSKCGFGDKKCSPPRKKYTLMYIKEVDGQFTCKRCSFQANYMQAIHKHLKECLSVFLEELKKLDSQENFLLSLEEKKLFLTSADRLFLQELKDSCGFLEDFKSPVKEKSIVAKKPAMVREASNNIKKTSEMISTLNENAAGSTEEQHSTSIYSDDAHFQDMDLD